jgi:hypothetical protein
MMKAASGRSFHPRTPRRTARSLRRLVLYGFALGIVGTAVQLGLRSIPPEQSMGVAWMPLALTLGMTAGTVPFGARVHRHRHTPARAHGLATTPLRLRAGGTHGAHELPGPDRHLPDDLLRWRTGRADRSALRLILAPASAHAPGSVSHLVGRHRGGVSRRSAGTGGIRSSVWHGHRALDPACTHPSTRWSNSHVTVGFQSANMPAGLFFHAQAWSAHTPNVSFCANA